MSIPRHLLLRLPTVLLFRLWAVMAATMTEACADEAAPDAQRFQQAMTIVAAKDPVERQLAMLEVTSPDLIRALARYENDLEVRRTATLMLIRQDDLQLQALDSHATIREAAVTVIADESFLVSRVRSRDELSPTVRDAIVRALRTQASLAEAAKNAYHRDVREAAAKRVIDPGLSASVRTAQSAIKAEVLAVAHSSVPAERVRLALKGSFDAICLAAANQLQDPDEFVAVASAAADREVHKIVLEKMAIPELLKVAAQAVNPAMRLAAAHKAREYEQESPFRTPSSLLSSSASMNESLAALALLLHLQDDLQVRRIRKACREMILQHDESCIPEIVDLLMLYDDSAFAAFCSTCGQPDLENAGRRWLDAHGYKVEPRQRPAPMN